MDCPWDVDLYIETCIEVHIEIILIIGNNMWYINFFQI
jgi:hypothetical protein